MEFDDPQLKYLSTCPLLPPERPVGFPHLIDTEKLHEDTDTDDLRLADGIATMIYKWKPAELEKFLRVGNTKYDLLRDERENRTTIFNIKIRRVGNLVTVSGIILQEGSNGRRV